MAIMIVIRLFSAQLTFVDTQEVRVYFVAHDDVLCVCACEYGNNLPCAVVIAFYFATMCLRFKRRWSSPCDRWPSSLRSGKFPTDILLKTLSCLHV